MDINELLYGLLYGILIAIIYGVVKYIVKESKASADYRRIEDIFTAKWQVLNSDERIELLYAFYGKELKDCWDSGKEVYTDKESYKDDHDFGIRSIMLDGVYDWEDRIFEECKLYEELSTIEIEKEYNRIVEEKIGDFGNKRCYDKEYVNSLLDHIFSNKKELSNILIEKRKIRESK